MINQYELETFRALLQNAFRDHKQANNPKGNGIPCIRLEMGKKNCRVVKFEDHGVGQYDHASAYCFIDLSTGDILKPAGYKAPVKGKRGNILEANPLSCCGPYGIKYLRGDSGFTFEESDKINSIVEKQELSAPPAEIVI